jgi:hypothetical protein
VTGKHICLSATENVVLRVFCMFIEVAGEVSKTFPRLRMPHTIYRAASIMACMIHLQMLGICPSLAIHTVWAGLWNYD